MLISNEQLTQYERDGYLVLEDFVDRASCDRARRGSLPACEGGGRRRVDSPLFVRRIERPAHAGQPRCAAVERWQNPGTISMSLAGRTLLQVDQAAPAHQSVLRYVGECCEVANLDRCVRLRARCHHQETAKSPGIALPTSTDLERNHV